MTVGCGEAKVMVTKQKGAELLQKPCGEAKVMVTKQKGCRVTTKTELAYLSSRLHTADAIIT